MRFWKRGRDDQPSQVEAGRDRRGPCLAFLDSDDDAGRVREAYGDDTHRRLAEVKATYDPDNVFHHNKNIQPLDRVGAGPAQTSA